MKLTQEQIEEYKTLAQEAQASDPLFALYLLSCLAEDSVATIVVSFDDDP